jgi:hypothetical protein
MLYPVDDDLLYLRPSLFISLVSSDLHSILFKAHLDISDHNGALYVQGR